MAASTINTLFHFSFAVNDLDRARKFYGELLGCPEGRRMPGRADFNFFGHHIVAHLSPADVVGENCTHINSGKTPLHHFGVVVPLEEFEKISAKLSQSNADFLSKPEVHQKGSVREQMLMTCRDGCGNAVEFKGLRNITDVYAVPEHERVQA
ncbi:MAG: VOC family protein [Pseudomonadota bacterium]